MCLIWGSEDLSWLNSELAFLLTSLSRYTKIARLSNVNLRKMSIQKYSEGTAADPR